jgi:hypothetical protein
MASLVSRRGAWYMFCLKTLNSNGGSWNRIGIEKEAIMKQLRNFDII